MHDDLQARDLLPDEHLVDMGYTSAALLFDSQEDYEVTLFGPVWEKHATGYEIDAFVIDWENRTVTCPQGHTSNPWTMGDHRRNHELTRVKFKRIECEPCPVHDLCTKHHRASQWFAREKLTDEAINHAIAAHDFDFAATLMEALGNQYLVASWGNFAIKRADDFPDDVLCKHPRLALRVGMNHGFFGHADQAQRYL